MTYSEEFFDLETMTALAAAQIILPDVLKATEASDVIDVGCGTGAWLSVAAAHDCYIIGVDGHAPINKLLIDYKRFVYSDLTHGFNCFDADLAICLEVAEHLPEASAGELVAGLCKAKYVLWSAAIPGQGGIGHINEQWPSWWSKLFREHDYIASTDIRELHWHDERIVDFYRQNIMIWAKVDDLTMAGYSPWSSGTIGMGPFNRVHPDLAKAKGWGDPL